MAITISNLTNKKGNNSYTFADLHLDLEESRSSSNNRNSSTVNGSDIIADTDEQAIKNEIRNFFNQKRYLQPLFNFNAQKYIGSPLTEMGARSLGQEIDRGINLFMPRVRVDRILAAPDFQNQAYVVALYLTLPNFGTSVMLRGSLNNNGSFEFVN